MSFFSNLFGAGVSTGRGEMPTRALPPQGMPQPAYQGPMQQRGQGFGEQYVDDRIYPAAPQYPQLPPQYAQQPQAMPQLEPEPMPELAEAPQQPRYEEPIRRRPPAPVSAPAEQDPVEYVTPAQAPHVREIDLDDPASLRHLPPGVDPSVIRDGDVVVYTPPSTRPGPMSGDRPPQVPPQDPDYFPQQEPCPSPAPQPRPRPKPHPRPLPPSSAERIANIHRAERKVDRAANKAKRQFSNISNLLALGGHAIKRDLWSKEMAVFLKESVEEVAGKGIDNPARAGALAAIKQYKGAEAGRGAVWHAAFAALDHIGDERCDVIKGGEFLRKSFAALEELGRHHPPCACGCNGDAAHDTGAQPQEQPAAKAVKPKRRKAA